MTPNDAMNFIEEYSFSRDKAFIAQQSLTQMGLTPNQPPQSGKPDSMELSPARKSRNKNDKFKESTIQL